MCFKIRSMIGLLIVRLKWHPNVVLPYLQINWPVQNSDYHNIKDELFSYHEEKLGPFRGIIQRSDFRNWKSLVPNRRKATRSTIYGLIEDYSRVFITFLRLPKPFSPPKKKIWPTYYMCVHPPPCSKLEQGIWQFLLTFQIGPRLTCEGTSKSSAPTWRLFTWKSIRKTDSPYFFSNIRICRSTRANKYAYSISRPYFIAGANPSEHIHIFIHISVIDFS